MPVGMQLAMQLAASGIANTAGQRLAGWLPAWLCGQLSWRKLYLQPPKLSWQPMAGWLWRRLQLVMAFRLMPAQRQLISLLKAVCQYRELAIL